MENWPILDALPRDGCFWRLVWIGPFIADVLGGFQCPATFSRSDTLESAKAGSDLKDGLLSQREVFKFDYGFLPFLEIGSLWHNGAVCQRFGLDEIQVRIDADFSEMIQVAELSTDSKFLDGDDLLSYVGKFAVQRAQPNTASIATLIVPSIEIFRFYYGGGSTRLCRYLLDGKYLQNKKNIATAFGRNADNSQFVKLAYRIHDGDAINVARLCNESIAEDNLKSAYATGWFRKTLWSLQIGLPFHGETDLRVAGRRVKLANGSKAFLAFRIIECSRPYPKVYILKDRHTDGTDSASSSNAIPLQQSRLKRMRKPTQTLSSISDELASGYDIEATDFSSFISPSRFVAATVETASVELVGDGNLFKRLYDNRIGKLAVAPRSGESDVGPAEFRPNSNEAKGAVQPHGLDDFEDALRLLTHAAFLKGISLEILTSERREFKDLENSWSRLNGSPRQYAIAKIRMLARDCYLFECEAASNTVAHPVHAFYSNSDPFTNGKSSFDEALVKEEISNCEENAGIVKPESVGRIVRLNIRHPEYGTDGFTRDLADRIVSRLEKALKKPDL